MALAQLHEQWVNVAPEGDQSADTFARDVLDRLAVDETDPDLRAFWRYARLRERPTEVAHEVLAGVDRCIAVIATYFLARRIVGSVFALLATIVFATSPVTIGLANNPNSHATAVCFVTIGMLMLLHDMTEEQAERRDSFAELLELNAIETHWQKLKCGHNMTREKKLEWLREKNVLARLRAALAVPENQLVWTIPHNGLRFASQAKDRDEMSFFHEVLIKWQPGFASWDFESGETPTLRKDVDLAAFRNTFPELDK